MKVKLIIELELEVNVGRENAEADAFYVVDELLDRGVLQEAIKKHELSAPDMEVTSAISRRPP